MKILTTILALLCFPIIYAQGEASNWFFGSGAGLVFDPVTGNVTPTDAGRTTINTNEGCSSISDSSGNLLFYTDGRNVWDKNHQIMPNGDYSSGSGLFGDPSSTSSGLIVPKPGNANQYYIFTVDEPHHNNSWAYPNQGPANVNGNPISEYSDGGTIPFDDDGFNNGLNYTLVDLTLNGGRGDVVVGEKNKPLITYDQSDQLESSYKCSEKISAVEHDDRQSYWVITHFMDTFYSFRVDSNGVNSTPVTTPITPLITINGYRRNAIGYMKSSPNGEKIAICHTENGNTQGVNTNFTGSLWLYDFDDATGVVSNPVSVLSNANVYGTEFSPDSSKLYGTSGRIVYQFDLEAANISGSRIELTNQDQFIGALQLGPNGKIYAASTANSTALDVINNPDATGLLADYVINGQPLSPGTSSTIGLPPFIQSFFLAKIEVENLCFGNATQFTIDSSEPYDTIVWDFGDGTTSSLDAPTHTYTAVGDYTISANITLGPEVNVFSKTISIYEVPTAFMPTDLLLCDDNNDDSVTIDLSTRLDFDILGGQSTAVFEVTYYESLADANNKQNAISTTYQNSTNPVELFARVDNKFNTQCYAVTSFDMVVYDSPTATPIVDQKFCDDDSDTNSTNGRTTINMLDFDSQILDNQNASDYSISYHLTPTDADNGINALPPLYYNNAPFNYEVFVRIENNLNTNCYDTTAFEIIINPLPEVNNVNLLQCDIDEPTDGFTTFNLTESNEELANYNSNRSVKFFESLTNAETSTNAIDGSSYINIQNPQTMYAQVIDDLTQCFSIAELVLEVSTTQANDADIEVCDDDGTEDGFYTFDLSLASSDVLMGLPSSTTLQYYETYQEALLENNPLTNTYTNVNPSNQTIYARVENTNNCYGINKVELIVNSLPQLDTDDEIFYCLNEFPKTITLSNGLISGNPNAFYYDWSTGETTKEIQVNQIGTYSVRVTNNKGCSKIRAIEVVPSNVATLEAIAVQDASNNNTVSITVSGEGDYEFSLDDEFNNFQDSPVFENVAAGFHTVFIRDKNNCGTIFEDISVIGFPRFFTPNGDGFNDTWHVTGIQSSKNIGSEIYIFDRYGKLISSLNPLGAGWDGTFNGYPLPQSDYWFVAKIKTPTREFEYKGHFTLRR